ncbi:DUF4942 domain-containing protein [Pandoraea pnomenusa]|nr:DUF4942 domain-containing protein [Pandoraea pnomenusa]
MLATLLAHQAHCALPDFRGKLARFLVHGSIFSRVGASSKSGAIHCVLDAQPEPDHRQGMYSFVSLAQHKRQAETVHAYFHLRWFKNGNGHLTFSRPDLVDAMNKILAKHYPNALACEAR